MYTIVCLDVRNGIAFNNRRQSRDSHITERICNMVKNSRLLMSEYSKQLFPVPCQNILISENPIGEAESGDYCFVENNMDYSEIDKIERLIIYRWDKVYPQDEAFNIDLLEWRLVSKEEFCGNSHEKITEEIYSK